MEPDNTGVSFLDSVAAEAEIKNKRLRWDMHALSWAVLLPCAVFFTAGVLLDIYFKDIAFSVGAFFGADEERVTEIFRDPAANELIQCVLSLTLLTLPFIIVCRLRGKRVSDICGFNRPLKGTVLPHLFLGLGFCAFANIAVHYAGEVFEQFGFKPDSSKAAMPQGVFGFIIAVISTAVIPALVEEFAFRGIIMGIMRPYGEAFSILASSVAFGLLHGNFEQIPFAFLVGLVLGYIRIKGGSLAICMVVHGANNLISVILSYLKNVPSGLLSIIYTAYILLALLAAVLGIALLKDKKPFAFAAPDRGLPAFLAYRHYFLSPGTIMLFALYIYRAFENY